MSWKDKFRAAERERDENSPEEELFEGTLYAHYKGMKWWKTIVEGFKILGKTYLPSLLIFVSISVIFAIISTLAMTGFNWTLTFQNENVIKPLIDGYKLLYPDTWQDTSLWDAADLETYNLFRRKVLWNQVINLFINYLPLVICGIITQYYFLEKAKGRDITLIESIKYTFRGERIGITLLCMAILMIVVSAGFSFFVIFGIVVLIMIGLCIPTLVDSNLGTKDVLNEGFRLAKDFRLRTTILLICVVRPCDSQLGHAFLRKHCKFRCHCPIYADSLYIFSSTLSGVNSSEKS
jgi:hypothetical protein